MKNTIIRSTIMLIFISTINVTYSQNIKKAFKELHENKNYTYAEDIFKSEKYKNTSPGLFGMAYIYHKRIYVYKERLSSTSNKRQKILQNVYAYSHIIKSEDLFSGVSDKDKKNLADYFYLQNIKGLKKSIEVHFLQMERVDFKSIFKDLREISKGSEFYTALENKYIKDEFGYIKSKNYGISYTEKLMNKFPENEKNKTLQRYIDSLRMKKASSIKTYSILLNEHPDNQFKTDIINKIKKINKDFKIRLYKKGSGYKKIIFFDEVETEEKAIKILTDRYYSSYQKNKYAAPPTFFYMEMSDADVKRFKFKNKFIIFILSTSSDYHTAFKLVDKYQPYYKNCYLLDLDNGVQILSKEKVYKYGKSLNQYSVIAVIKTGKYRYSEDVYKPINEVITQLEEKTRHKIINHYNSRYEIEFYPKDNPFPVKYSLVSDPEFDSEKDAIIVIFLSNYKQTYTFEIEKDYIEHAYDRIMKKESIYFKK